MLGVRAFDCQFPKSTLFILLLTVALMGGGCASKASPPATVAGGQSGASRSAVEPVDESEQQAAEIEALRSQVAESKLILLEKEAQLSELQDKLGEAIQEVVRTKAKLQSVESRAEAASTMAEAEVALKAAQAGSDGQDLAPEVMQAEQLMVMSAHEFENENYGGSLYLANQAKTLLGSARGSSGTDASTQPDEVRFSIPLRLQVTTTSNVREGPGLGFEVLFTLQESTPLVGHAYMDEWVRIRLDDGRNGWIHQSLVSNR